MLILERIILKIIRNERYESLKNEAGSYKENSLIEYPFKIYNNKNFFMEEKTFIGEGATIMNTRAKFIMKKNSGAAFGLTVVTGNHMSVPGMWLNQVTNKVKSSLDKANKYDKDVIINEDVWIGSRVILLSGVEVGRGAVVGSGSVCRESIPPYAIAIGNPAKVIGFKFSFEDIIKHEEALYPENERLSVDLLEENYEKYYLDRLRDISDFTSL